jgi:hypothetical protein
VCVCSSSLVIACYITQEMQHRIRGEVRYYPHDGSRETLPTGNDLLEIVKADHLNNNEEENDDDDATEDEDVFFDALLFGGESSSNKRSKGTLTQGGNMLTQASQGTAIGRAAMTDDNFVDLTSDSSDKPQISKVFDVYWSHRLVPESKVNRLPFFPSDKWLLDHRDEIGPLCLDRLHGSLFFDWHFPISNNKLRLLPAYDSLSAEGLPGDDVLSKVLHDQELVTVRLYISAFLSLTHSIILLM